MCVRRGAYVSFRRSDSWRCCRFRFPFTVDALARCSLTRQYAGMKPSNVRLGSNISCGPGIRQPHYASFTTIGTPLDLSRHRLNHPGDCTLAVRLVYPPVIAHLERTARPPLVAFGVLMAASAEKAPSPQPLSADWEKRALPVAASTVSFS